MNIRFRTWIDGQFYYWGHIESNVFAGPVHSSGESLTIDEMMKRTQMFTGLKDNNGKEIYLGLYPNIGKELYEGDIVNVTFPNKGRVRGVIEWRQFAWQYKSLFALDDSLNSQPLHNNPYPNYAPLDCAGYQFEIIGNINQNPELLERR